MIAAESNSRLSRVIIRLALACAFLVLFQSTVHALEWPVSPAIPSLFFGERDGNVVSRGLVFPATDTIRSAGAGTVLITLSENRNLSGFPGTLGNAVVLVHDEDLATVYGNLASLDRIEGKDSVDSQTVFGPAGNGGWGPPGETRFEVLDLAKKTILNPLLLLPALRDTKAPRISDIVAVSAGNQTYTLGSSKYLKQGDYRIYANVADQLDSSRADLAPFRITVLVNGKERIAMPFEILKAENGAVFLSKAEFTAENLYADTNRTYLGTVTFVRGQTDIAVIARDIADNERSAQFSLIIE